MPTKNGRARPTSTSKKTKAPQRSRTAPKRKPASDRELSARTCDEVMTPEPITLNESENLFATARMMRERDIGDVIVLDASDTVRGIVTDRDIVVRAVAENLDPNVTTVGTICSDILTVVAPGDTIDSAVKLMRERALRRLPVVDHGKAVGILSIGDLAEEFDGRSALAEISAAPPNL